LALRRILGFGVEGKDSLQYFLDKSESIFIYDQKTEEELQSKKFKNDKVKWICGPNYLDGGLNDFDLIVRSPGFYRYNPILLEAEKNGAKVTSNTIIFFENCKTPIIGVTGTKGKGTTSSLITEGLKSAGKKVVLLGNIGEPMLSSLKESNDCDFVVLELSSFQTIDLPISPHIAVVTNITSDHLDWHKDLDEYIQAKAQLWKNQTKEDFLVLNKADVTSRVLGEKSPGTVIWYLALSESRKEYAYSGQYSLSHTDEEEIYVNGECYGDLDFFELPGRHNIENLLAALSAISLIGANIKKAWEGVMKFKGLEHRLEKVAEIENIAYINDSYATNPEPTIAAIHSYLGSKVLILGGSKKGADFTKMAEEIVKSNVHGVVLIGDEAENIENALDKAGYKGDKKKGMSTMVDIVNAAKDLANSNDMVILSPACASFGLFENYKDRGKQFKEAVLNLK
jgi:UDP-N-acetylmuramoylalanine--D-glutamate ligase